MTYRCYHRELWSSQSRPTFWYRLRGTAASFPGPSAWSMWSCWRWKETGRLIRPPGFSRGEVVSFFNSLDSPTKDCFNQQYPSGLMDRNICEPQFVRGPASGKMVRCVFGVFLLCFVPSLPPHWFSRIKEDICWPFTLITKQGSRSLDMLAFEPPIKEQETHLYQERYRGLHHVCLCWDEMGFPGPLKENAWPREETSVFFLKAFAPNAHSLRKEEEADLKNKQTNKEKMQGWQGRPGFYFCWKLPNVYSEEQGLVHSSWEYLSFSSGCG